MHIYSGGAMCEETEQYDPGQHPSGYPFAGAGITAQQYRDIGLPLQWKQPGDVRPDLLLSVPNHPRGRPLRVSIDTTEFTAVCPWTGLPDTGTVTIGYSPLDKVLELKALKYYLLSYRDVGIIQEDAANRMLVDLVHCCHPKVMRISLDYMIRGGLKTVVEANYTTGDFGEEWENEDRS